jgi:hypothetical protein
MINSLERITAILRSKKGGSRSSIKAYLLGWTKYPIFLSVIFIPMVTKTEQPIGIQADPGVYWGSYLSGEHYGLGNAPWETSTIDVFRDQLRQARLHHSLGSVLALEPPERLYRHRGWLLPALRELPCTSRSRQRGAIPMINWNSWSGDAGGSTNQPNYQLSGHPQRRLRCLHPPVGTRCQSLG